MVVLDGTVTAYPQGTYEWIAQLESLATEVRRGQLDGTSLTAALDLVRAAVVSRQRLGYGTSRGDGGTEEMTSLQRFPSFLVALRGWARRDACTSAEGSWCV